MSWRDRDYNRGSSSFNDFFANPAALLALSVPFGTWFGARVRLHFWLLLGILFIFINALQNRISLSLAIVMAGLMIVSLLIHEFGHRLAATAVGGRHDEFMLWPAGGMIPPEAPSRPLPTFIAHAGGIAANLVVAGATYGALHILHHVPFIDWAHPWRLLLGGIAPLEPGISLLYAALHVFVAFNISLVATNLFLVIYWFDGAYLLQAILSPWLGLFKAISVTCIVGMIESAGLFILAILGPDFMGMVVAALMFSSSYAKRQALRANGPEELQNVIADSATYEGRAPRRKLRKNWFKTARRRVNQEQAEQARIDAILDKVHDHGLHSLTWWEKRALKKATERQRQRDMAERF